MIAANSPKFEAVGGIANLTSLGIQHVFFIVKENRTYDQVFGDLPKGNSDPKLVMYGRDVTPNHHALAEKYVTLDNFHTGGAISFDGHQWLMQAFVSDYVERAFAASPRGYAWNMSDALTVSPAGLFWQVAPRSRSTSASTASSRLPARWDPEHPKRRSTSTRSEELTWTAILERLQAGQVADRGRLPQRRAGAREVHGRRAIPNDSTSIPDQIRADELSARAARVREDRQAAAAARCMTLNSDHTNGTRPGSPTPRAMVADDDLGAGPHRGSGIRRARFWAKSLILVVEDDAQDGIDHVDGHRTVALAIGPHVRRGAVDSTHYNHTSMVRTIQEIFEIPAKTRFLASARAMHSIFTGERRSLRLPDAARRRSPLDEMNQPLNALERPGALGRQTIGRDELASSRRRAVGRLESHSLVGQQRLQYALPHARKEVNRRTLLIHSCFRPYAPGAAGRRHAQARALTRRRHRRPDHAIDLRLRPRHLGHRRPRPFASSSSSPSGAAMFRRSPATSAEPCKSASTISTTCFAIPR